SRLPAFLVSALTTVPRSTSLLVPDRHRRSARDRTATGTPSSANGGQESECGWCKNKWGVSWQITPRVLTRCPFSIGVGCFHHRPIITRMQAARAERPVAVLPEGRLGHARKVATKQWPSEHNDRAHELTSAI